MATVFTTFSDNYAAIMELKTNVREKLFVALIAGAIALNAWMLFWGSEYAEASGTLQYRYVTILREYEPAPHIAEFDVEGNVEFAKGWIRNSRVEAAYAKNYLPDDHVRARKARLMLVDVSGMIASGLTLMAFGLFLSRYRVIFARRSAPMPAERDINN